MLLLAEHPVYHPAAADVRPRPTAVVQYVVAVAPSVLEGVRQDRHRVEVSRLVHPPGQTENGVSAPVPPECHGAERVAEYLVDERYGEEQAATRAARPVPRPTPPGHRAHDPIH